MIVEPYCHEAGDMFPNYVLNQYEWISISDSFSSLLESGGVLLSNPYGQSKPATIVHNHGNKEVAKAIFDGLVVKWQSVEQKVFRNPLILTSTL